MKQRSISILICLLVGVSGQQVFASGSVKTTVVTGRLGLTISQTFRKIIRGKRQSSYYQRVRQRFYTLAMTAIPDLSRRLARIRSRVLLKGYRLDLPLHRCGRLPECARLKSARFPALVQLPGVVPKSNSRLAFTVILPFKSSPSQSLLAQLQRVVSQIAEKHAASRPTTPLTPTRIGPINHNGPRMSIALRPRILATPAGKGKLTKQLQWLVKRLSIQLGREFSSHRGVKLGRYDKRLAYYGDSKRLPGRVSVGFGSGNFHIVLVLVVNQANDSALKTFKRSLYDVMKRVAGGG